MKKFLLNLSTPAPQVKTWTDDNRNSQGNLMWDLIPVSVEGPETTGRESPPLYEGDTAQHAETERDDFGTIVTEITTVTTRRRYRVETT